MQEKYCNFYIAQNEIETPSQNDIQKQLETGSIEQKEKALKSLITCLIHDDHYPRMLMIVFNHLVPIQNQSHSLKKVLLYYWEFVEKVNQDGYLKQEMILVCNSIRNDLLHANEYIRGRTLRMLMRVMHLGILEPLKPSILENLNHQFSYVRRNAVALLYKIFLNFNDDLTPDIDVSMESLLQRETDLSTKRNAFLLLFHSNQEKALNYVSSQLNDYSDDIGDVIQLIILELLRKQSKQDVQLRQKLIKIINIIQKSNSSSVLFECANTLIQISSSQPALKFASNIYIQILLNHSDNNVKIILLDKLTLLNQKTHVHLQSQIVELSKVLNSQSLEIRTKTLELIKQLISDSNVQIVLPIFLQEIKKVQFSQETNDISYKNVLLEILLDCCNRFETKIAKAILDFIKEFIGSQKLNEKSSQILSTLLKDLSNNSENYRDFICDIIQEKLDCIKSEQFLKTCIWILGEYSRNDQVYIIIDQIKKSIGPLQLQKKDKRQDQQEDNKKILKTVILTDGTYGQQQVDQQQDIEESFLRTCIIENGYLAAVLSTSLIKLLYKIKNDESQFNKIASDILLILCAIARIYKQKDNYKNKQDASLIQKISMYIKLIINPDQFCNNNISWLENKIPQKKISIPIHQDEIQTSVSKMPDSLIQIRQLKGIQKDLALSDDEDTEDNIFENKVYIIYNKEQDFTNKLTKIVQLTGYSDPIYAEAFVNIHKYEIQFEILLINQLNEALQNVCIEFSSLENLRILDKPQQVCLAPYQSILVKTGIKLDSSQVGIIFPSINYENKAGISQAYMITNEIFIDMTDFIKPVKISQSLFRELWQKYEWENKIIINTQIIDSVQYIKFLQKNLKCELLTDLVEDDFQQVYSVNFYAKTTLNDDFLINLSMENIDNKLSGYLRIRSKNKGIVVSLGDKMRNLQQS